MTKKIHEEKPGMLSYTRVYSGMSFIFSMLISTYALLTDSLSTEVLVLIGTYITAAVGQKAANKFAELKIPAVKNTSP